MIESKVALRYAADVGGMDAFKKVFEAALHIGDRQIKVFSSKMGPGTSLDITYINLPKSAPSTGTEAAVNTLWFSVVSFGDDGAPPPTGKVAVSLLAFGLGKKHPLKSKRAAPSQVAKYIADFLNTVAKEVEPDLTYSNSKR